MQSGHREQGIEGPKMTRSGKSGQRSERAQRPISVSPSSCIIAPPPFIFLFPLLRCQGREAKEPVMLIDRRAFAASLGSMGIGWRAARGRPNMPRIGILLVENREPFASEFTAGLQEAGYSEGRNILLEF